MREEPEPNLLGRLHSKLREKQRFFNRFDLFRKYPIHYIPSEILFILSRLSLDGIEERPDDIFSYEWDDLIILDACRHDIYQEVKGGSDFRITKGSMSKDFIRKNFSSGDYSDVVYITANPFFSENKFKKLTGRKPENVFHEVFHTYRTDWNEEESTVLPESVVRDAETAESLFPDKKKIIHFMQPHHPFIGKDLAENGYDDILKDKFHENEWDLAMVGEIDHETVRKAYKENLELVVSHVEDLADNLSGTTMLTSDHGNLLGENGLYWHPPRSRAKPLRKVPMTELQ